MFDRSVLERKRETCFRVDPAAAGNILAARWICRALLRRRVKFRVVDFCQSRTGHARTKFQEVRRKHIQRIQRIQHHLQPVSAHPNQIHKGVSH